MQLLPLLPVSAGNGGVRVKLVGTELTNPLQPVHTGICLNTYRSRMVVWEHTDDMGETWPRDLPVDFFFSHDPLGVFEVSLQSVWWDPTSSVSQDIEPSSQEHGLGLHGRRFPSSPQQPGWGGEVTYSPGMHLVFKGSGGQGTLLETRIRLGGVNTQN